MNEQKAYDSLTGKQQLFVDYYIMNKRNGTQAYMDAGYKAKTRHSAAAAAHRLLKNDIIKEAIKERAMPDQLERAITIRHIIDKMRKIADGETTYMKWFGEGGESTPKHADQINASKLLMEFLFDKELKEAKGKAEIERIKAQTELLLSRVNAGEDEQSRLDEDLDLLEGFDKEVDKE